MAPSTLRKAIGAVKDQTSIGIAKVESNMAPELEVAIVKATSHDDDPADEKYVRQILSLTSYSGGLMNDGGPVFQEEILYATRKGTRLLNMSDFRDEAHSSSWDHSAFVRAYAMYLDQRLELMLFDRKRGKGSGGSSHGNGEGRNGGIRDTFWSSSPTLNEYDYGDFRGDNGYGAYGMPRRTRSYGDMNETVGGRDGREEKKTVTPLREMKPEMIFGKMGHLQRFLDRFLSCRPTGLAKISRMILYALYPVMKESFQLYADICEVLAVLLDRFFNMKYPDSVKAFDAYTSAAKQIDELIAFCNWCKEIGVVRSSEYPEVQRISSKLLDTLGVYVRDGAERPISPEKELPPPPKEADPVKPQEDLVNLRDDAVTADHQGNKLALALFNVPSANSGNGSWEAFPSNGQPEVTSAWQTPASEPGKADWELALVESASNLPRQKAALGGGFDPLLLNGMYDQGTVMQHVSTAQLSGGSASSVALPGPGKTTQVLALPAPDGTVQNVNQDPFAASLSIPPPSYVQISDMEKKQHFVVQEQQVWQQYARDGMQGQTSLAKISNPGSNYGPGPMPVMPFGMPPVNGMGPPAGYYYTPY
ncbi:putative clathrin assembly protein [Hibiscus syriacus]|uniref:Clathrin assembly protein n=1 Tax=Hibiscus syriacus TaxID=106335 RepID=A0A6A2WTR2_HIBSY|nr:putative clathrin assembly protein [Hibiscus syriacus]